MPFQRPDLKTLIDRAAADIEGRLPGADARLRRNVLRVLAMVHAGAVHGLYGYLDYLALQILPDTAEAEYLERWASVWGVSRRPAAAAKGTVTFSGSNGAVIPAGSLLQRSDAAEFTTTADGTIAAGAATVAVAASALGTAGNTAAGSTLSLVNPIAGVNGQATVAAGGIAGGAESEADDALRNRLLARIQQPPHGGAAFDYEAWALEVPGITRAWVLPGHLGVGTVGIAVVSDDLDPIIPAAALVEQVQAHIDPVRPVTADAVVFAPIPVPIDFTLQLTPNTAAVQAAVEAELQDLLRRAAQPEDGGGSGTILISHIREAISVAAGETDHVLTAPAGNVTFNPGEMAVMGVITWQ